MRRDVMFQSPEALAVIRRYAGRPWSFAPRGTGSGRGKCARLERRVEGVCATETLLKRTPSRCTTNRECAEGGDHHQSDRERFKVYRRVTHEKERELRGWYALRKDMCDLRRRLQ